MKCNAYHLFFQNLSNPIKIKIVEALKVQEMSVTELSKKLKIEQSKLSHALMNLRHCNIVVAEQKGKQRIYTLNKKTIVPILKIIDNHRTNFCPGCKVK
jgi:ArsR family transcriptional regulator, lead/cadmium/zinc/bismuth-responsive transcriptional repressor